MTEEADPRIVEGLAAIAVTVAEMGGTNDDIRAQLISMMFKLHIDDPAEVLRAAAAAVGRLPTPMEESAGDTERQRGLRALLGVTSAEDQLAAGLRGRDMLEKLAAEFDDAP